MITPDKIERGWVMVWRIIEDAPWYKNAKISHLAQHLLRKVNHKDGYFYMNGEQYFVKRGETVTGRITLSEETGLSQQEIRHALDVLKDSKFLTVISTSRSSKLSVCNYAEYQDYRSENNQVTTKQQPSNNQVTTTNKECKECKERKECKETTTAGASEVEEVKKPELKDRIRQELLEKTKIEDNTDLIALKDQILNCFGVQVPASLSEESTRAEYAISKSILENVNCSVPDLIGAIYDYLYHICVNASCKTGFTKKQFSSVMLYFSAIRKNLAHKGLIKKDNYQPRKEMTVEEVIAKYNKKGD